MKTGFYRINRILLAYSNLFCFQIKKFLFGFDVANVFIQRVDKKSLQLILKKNGASIGQSCDLESGLIFHNCTNYNNLSIGNNCHVGKNCFFDLREKILIYDNVCISMQVTFITHIDVGKSPIKEYFQSASKSITVENGAYIGANSKILMGVILGADCFVAAGSLVNRSVKAYSLVAGIPAKQIREYKSQIAE